MTFHRAAAPFLLFLLFLGLASCAPTCRDEPPQTAWDPPLCSDQEFDASLLDNATHGDHSAVELLEMRVETAIPIPERLTIPHSQLQLLPGRTAYLIELRSSQP